MENTSKPLGEFGAKTAPNTLPVTSKGGFLGGVKHTAKEIFGQLLTSQFWKGLGVLVAKTIVETAVETFFVSFGESMIFYGKKRKPSAEVDEVKSYFKTHSIGGQPVQTPAAAAFGRTFNPSSATFGRDPYPPPVPVSPNDGGFPGLSPTFRS